MESTSSKILAKIKRFGLEMFSFGSSKIFLKNFAGVLGMLLFFFFMTTTWLKCYTDHGEALHMPNYVGMNLLEVKKIAKKKGFAVVVDSAYVEGMAPLTITDQHPKPENLIKEKRTVYLTVIQKGVQMVKLPGYKDEYIIYVKPLTGMGIKYNSTTEVDTRVAEGTILDIIYNEKSILDQLKDNTMEDIPSGSKLKFVVSEKGYGNTRVPNLICKTTAEAQLILENLNLNENIIRDATVSDKSTAYVWWQDPAAGSSIRYGEQVKIQIMQNIPDDCEENELEAPREDAPEKPQEEEEF